jgi:calcineurin-like phosphoesterase family protein
VRTAVLSDLHLGARSGADVLRRPEVRAVLVEAIAGADRLVLLGDALELRHGPIRAALEVARPLFQDIGEAMAGREVVLLPGNHDHPLIAPWLEARRFRDAGLALSLEERIDPAEAAPAAAQIAAWLGEAELSIAYPGMWLREDVYAMHGHYLDCHLTVPTFERIGVAVMERLVGDPPLHGAPDAYEARLAPIYAWLHELAQQERGGAASAGGADVSARVWHGLAGGGAPPRAAAARARSLRRRAGWLALGAAIPPAIGLLNRLGLGPFSSDLSGVELRRAGLRGIRAVAEALDVEAAHLVFGHTHRAGPLAGDDEAEWRGPGATRLVNSGSWVYQRHFLSSAPGESPYWPGVVVEVEEQGPPRVRRVLVDRPHEALRPVR